MKNKKSFMLKTLREWAIALMDIFVTTIAFACAILLVQFHEITPGVIINALKVLPVLLAVMFAVFFCLRIFKRIWRYASLLDYVMLAIACAVTCAIFWVLNGNIFHLVLKGFRIATYVATFAFMVLLMVTMRIIYSAFYSKLKDNVIPQEKKRTMIIGAGYTARNILEEITRSNSPMKPVCLIDDDVDKIGRTVYGVQVVGNTNEIPKYAKRYDVDVIIFAIPSISEKSRQKILNNCMATDCEIKVLPYVSEMIYNADFVSQIKDVNIEDLLGRPPIRFDDVDVAEYIGGKTCLITGGGGSIGSELCRQIAKYRPKKIVIVDIYENTAYEIQQELLRQYGKELNLVVEIASVTDYDKVDDLLSEHSPEIIFHAAAHKHVPLMETNPEEAVKNNVVGTFNVAFLANVHNVEKFIMISTDKAVNPTNVMGATKRCCEMIIQYMSQQRTKTEYAAVRFGNVLGSHGSVIPLFREQILKGGPLTVTHKDIIRYFMTIPEAVSLVLQAGAFAHGGEIFVLDMGEPVKILTLAENLIKMMGYKPYDDIEIRFTGLRPGEKLFEELLMNEEGLTKTDNNKIFIGKQIPISDTLISSLNDLRSIAATNNKEEVVRKLREIVPTFKPDPKYGIREKAVKSAGKDKSAKQRKSRESE